MQTTDISTALPTEFSAVSTQEEVSSSDSDFKTFLTLLTAQMRNQDPLKPMDSTEFVAQLASFSAVEQQIDTNSKLGELLNFFTNSPAANMTEWLGKEVPHEGSASYDGQPIEIGATIHLSADIARLVVRDENTAIIHSQYFDSNSDTVIWNGNTQETGVAPTGRYSFEVESYADGNLIEATSGSVFDLVTEVRLNQGNTVLIFEDGTAIYAEDADAVRMHQS